MRRAGITWAANVALVISSLAVGYFVVEFAFFRLMLPNMALDVRPHLPETAGVLLQTSKSGSVPRDYIAILGDSYAEGLGDALLSQGGNAARGFDAAHVVHDRTGRDVVSFGRGGSSSAEGLVRQPARTLGGSRCLLFPTLADPSRIFAYFYEGNDIQDNVRFAARVAASAGKADAAAIDAYLSGRYAAFHVWECNLYLGDVVSRMIRFIYQHDYLGIDPLGREGPGGNILRLDEQEVDAPAPLEGPALEVGDDDIHTGIEVFDRSLAWLRARFPDVPITVVYIPAPLSIYRLTGARYVYAFEPREDGKVGSTTPAQIEASSDRICDLVRHVAERRSVAFVDARPALRAAAQNVLIHGPADWRHLNADGYRALGALLAQQVEPLKPAGAK